MKRGAPWWLVAIILLVGYALSPGPRAAFTQAISQLVQVTPTGSGGFPVAHFTTSTISGPASTTVAATAGTAVCTTGVAVSPSAWYQASLWLSYVSGTETLNNNMQFNVSGTTKVLFVVARPAGSNAAIGAQTQYVLERVWIPGGTFVSVTAVANATAGAVYDCQIDLTQIPG